MTKDIHECEYKKGKMWDIEEAHGGDFCCSRCRAKINKEQIHPEALRVRRVNRR